MEERRGEMKIVKGSRKGGWREGEGGRGIKGRNKA